MDACMHEYTHTHVTSPVNGQEGLISPVNGLRGLTSSYKGYVGLTSPVNGLVICRHEESNLPFTLNLGICCFCQRKKYTFLVKDILSWCQLISN